MSRSIMIISLLTALSACGALHAQAVGWETKAGAITIDAKQDKVMVYLNGKFFGVASGPSTIDTLEPGDYTILVKKRGFQDWERVVNVAGGAPQVLNVDLVPLEIPQDPSVYYMPKTRTINPYAYQKVTGKIDSFTLIPYSLLLSGFAGFVIYFAFSEGGDMGVQPMYLALGVGTGIVGIWGLSAGISRLAASSKTYYYEASRKRAGVMDGLAMTADFSVRF